MRERAVVSPRTALILLLLRGRALSAPQLAEYLGIPSRQVHAYLAFLRRRGLVASNSYTYSLTSRGVEYVNKYRGHLEHVVRSRFRLNLAKLGSTKLNSAKRIVEEIAGQYDLGDCVNIVGFLVEFRLRVGRKWWWPSQPDIVSELAELTRSSTTSVRECLARLESQGVLYLRKDGQRGVWKVRLSRQFDPLFEA